MNIQLKPRPLTVDEFMLLASKGAFEKDIGGVELHDGYIVQMNAKYLPHVGMQAMLVRIIGNMLQADKHLTCVSEPTIQFDTYNCREPDVAIYEPRAGMNTVLKPDTVRLLIEVANDSLANDLGEKALAYAAGNIPEYWVIDLGGQVTHVHTAPSTDGYGARRVVRFDESLTSAVLPAILVISEID